MLCTTGFSNGSNKISNMAKQKGWINVHIFTDTNEIVASRHPYFSKEEAERGIFIGRLVKKIGCFEIEWEGELAPTPWQPTPR